MSQDIQFELDEETDEFHLILDGEDKGPIDKESLKDSVGDLYLHFYMFKDRPPEQEYEANQSTEEAEEELEELETLDIDDIIEDAEEDGEDNDDS